MPIFSVIVPVYNGANFIERCVRSILTQTLDDFELIIIDDGSTDSTAQIVDKLSYEDNRIHVIHKLNGGVSSARNVGLNYSTGEWVVFADADDEILPEWLHCFFDKCDNAQIITQGIIFSGHNTLTKRFAPSDYSQNSVQQLVGVLIKEGILGYLFGKCFRRNIIEKNTIRFDESLRFREDDVFVLQYCEHIDAWNNSMEANYIYYLPNGDKNYGTSATACIEQVFRSLNVIFNNRIPDSIKQAQAWNVKGAAVERLIAGETLSDELRELYRDIISRNSKSIKSKLINLIILNSKYAPKLSAKIIQIIHNHLI